MQRYHYVFGLFVSLLVSSACAGPAGPPQAPWNFASWKAVAAHPEQTRGHIQFFVGADTQYKDSPDYRDTVNLLVIRQMNLLSRGGPDTVWPDNTPLYGIRGLIIAGDLTHTSRGNFCTANGECDDTALGRFDYHWAGGVENRSLLRIPVYEGLGNHDMGGQVAELVRARNRAKRPVLVLDENNAWTLTTTTSTHPLGHYGWEWDGVHFIQLNDHAGHEHSNPDTSPRHVESLDSLTFLEEYLAQHTDAETPVVLSQHMGFDEFSSQARGITRTCDALFDQHWKHNPTTRQIVNSLYTPERCLGVKTRGGSARVFAVPCDSPRAWVWKVRPHAGEISLSHPTRNLCLAADGFMQGNDITVEPCDQNDSFQTWSTAEDTLRFTQNICLSMFERWWSEYERQELYAIAEPHNVVALFSGHSHRYQTNMPVWSGIANKNAGTTFAGQFLAVRLNANTGHMQIARRCIQGGWKINPTQPTWVWSSVRDKGCAGSCDPKKDGDCFFEVRWDPPKISQNPK